MPMLLRTQFWLRCFTSRALEHACRSRARCFDLEVKSLQAPTRQQARLQKVKVWLISVRVIANYADIIVIRHPKDGAARLAAEYSPIPVINGGDGSHEHPTQTLCDIFTLKMKNKKLKNLKVAISGDLKGSRTIHSFVYALARFGAHIVPMPAPGMELPPHVDRRLREEFNCRFYSGDGTIGALYQTPDQPHQPALFSGPDFEVTVKGCRPGDKEDIRSQKISAVYVTRFQKERWLEREREYPKIDANFLKEPKYSKASVLHPLPRVDELDVSFDLDVRAAYFEQAAYGVPVRMALISLLLNLNKGKLFDQFEGGFRPLRMVIYEQPLTEGIRCANKNCITRDDKERPYVRNRFLRRKKQCIAWLQAQMRLLRERHRSICRRAQEKQMVYGRCIDPSKGNRSKYQGHSYFCRRF